MLLSNILHPLSHATELLKSVLFSVLSQVPLSTLAVRSIISQAHLLPIPSKLSPVIWAQGISSFIFTLLCFHRPKTKSLLLILCRGSSICFYFRSSDHALSIYPLPHILFLCDDVAPFDVTVTACRRCALARVLCAAPTNSCATSINPGSFASDFGFTMCRTSRAVQLQLVTPSTGISRPRALSMGSKPAAVTFRRVYG
jgi:hypothetical protein